MDLPNYPKPTRQITLMRLFQMVMLGVFVCILFISILFVYQQVFLTIEQVQSIIVLDSDLRFEAIDFLRLEKVQQAWETKHTTTTVPAGTNPFIGTPTLPPATGATTEL